MYEKIPGYRDAAKVRDKHLSERAMLLDSLEKYVSGNQYDHLPDWFSSKKPLWERAPCFVTPIVKQAIDSNGDLLLGEGRFPEFAAYNLEGEAADRFEKAIDTLIEQSRFRAASREAWSAAQGCGTSVSIFSTRNGRLCVETAYARWCTPETDVDGSVTRLEIQYPYLDVVQISPTEKLVKCKLYRRVITTTTDETWTPVLAPVDGTQPAWGEAALKITHGFGFCPVVWYAHMRGAAIVNEIDGKAIHRNLLDEIRAHDFTISQKQRAAMYAGDPQWIEIGVEPGYNPTGSNSGRRASMPGTIQRPGDSFQDDTYVTSGTSDKARRKGPGEVWQYATGDASKVKVQCVTLPADALKAIDDHARDIKGKIAEALGVVFIDASSLPNESRLSGKALNDLVRPQLARIDYYREDFGDHSLLPGLGMLIRVALVANLPIEGLDDIRTVVDSQPAWSWHAPSLKLVWGPYFKPSGEEEELLIRGTMAAVSPKTGTPILTPRQAIVKLQDVFGIKDVDTYMKELDAHVAETAARDLEKTQAEAKAQADAKPPAPAPAKPPAKKAA